MLPLLQAAGSADAAQMDTRAGQAALLALVQCQGDAAMAVLCLALNAAQTAAAQVATLCRMICLAHHLVCTAHGTVVTVPHVRPGRQGVGRVRSPAADAWWQADCTAHTICCFSLISMLPCHALMTRDAFAVAGKFLGAWSS